MTQAIGMHVRARLFAIQRELVGARHVDLDLAAGATVAEGWEALVERFPGLAPGGDSVRFARNGDYADPADRLEDGDELAVIPPVSGGAGEGAGDRAQGAGDATARSGPIIELREAPFGTEILGELANRLVTDLDGAVVGFLGRTRATPGTPAPGQEAEAARHEGRTVDALEYEAHDTMAVRVLEAIADEVAERFGITRLAIVHRTGDVPLGVVSIAVVAVGPHRDAAFLAARYAIDETKARAPIWKAERFEDGHVWIGNQARTGPDPISPDTVAEREGATS